jgi:oligopeptide transport system substrate-binding protein
LSIDPTTLEVVPNIATEFSTNEAGDVYTFKIRKGVYFHDDECFGGKGREMTPEDVKFSLDFLCSGNPLNQADNMFSNLVKGAKEYKSKSATAFPKGGVTGIKVKGEAVEITLNQPFMF